MRILIVLIMDDYVRNYLDTDAFRELQARHECTIAITDNCKRRTELNGRPGFVGVIRIERAYERAHIRLFNLLMWYHRKRSRTFRFRFTRYYRAYPNNRPKYIWRNVLGLLKAGTYVLLGNALVGPVVIRGLTARLPINPDLRQILEKGRPDLVLMPCHAHDAIGDDLATLSPQLGFRTMFLIDNWDNLSSKSIFVRNPDYLGVWGEQSREHADRIHGIPPERVFLLGTPRFEKYYEVRRQRPPSPYPFEYVLFCGSYLPFDELTPLHRLDDEIERNPDLRSKVKVVYRPHPARMERLSPDTFRADDFRHVALDRQMVDAYYSRDITFRPALDYYPALLANARGVVGPLTTLLLESVICGTPVVALAYDDGVHYTSPHRTYRYYVHFEGIDNILGLRLITEVRDLVDAFQGLFLNPATNTPEAIDASLLYFLFRDSRRYGERLLQAVDSIASARDIQNVGATSPVPISHSGRLARD